MYVALIPARGGSKRIPRKNLKAFHGKPVIAYSVETALNSGLFDEIIVSTDDQEIADVASALGASVPFMRPAELANDSATTLEVIQHAISWYEEAGKPLSLLCCIYATAPLIDVSMLERGREALTNERFDYAFSATSFDFPVQRGFRVLEGGGVEMLQPQYIETRSQDLEPVYHDAGQFYWGRPQAFRRGLQLFGERSKPIMIPRYRVQDIDTMEDWKVAENIFLACNLPGEDF